MCVCFFLKSCPTLCNPMDCIVHGILQARILEWVAFSFSRGSSQLRNRTRVSCTATTIFLPTEQSIKNYRSILINTESGHDIISEKTGHKAEYSVVISFFKNAWECVYVVSIFRKNLGSLEQQTMNSSKLFTHGRTTEPTLSIKMLFNLKNKSISTFEKEQDLFSVATPITKSLNTLK